MSGGNSTASKAASYLS
jgi:hypothetical protein